MRSHQDAPYAWVDVFNSPKNNDVIQIIDKKTLEVVKRIKMNKPSGKYNVYNEITCSEGTSH